mgnify:FL=1
MKKYNLKPASLAEREKFYEEEFDLEKVKKWFYSNGAKLPQLCSVDAGTETGIIIDKKLKGRMLYFPLNELKIKIKQYIPEDVYYDRNVYENPSKALRNLKFDNFIKQELAFDIDADNIKCKCPKGTKLCDNCIKSAFSWAKRMKKELEKDFRKVRIVYSGRGFHVHIFDKKAFLLNLKQRDVLNKKFAHYPIDPWVSRGHIRLIRMPYSLNGLVSRKVIPLKNNLRFYKELSYPKFLN